MILFWFAIGIMLAYLIARYNESNKLFWQLMLAFILGYAATVMVDRTINGDERNNKNYTQVCSIQEPSMSDAIVDLITLVPVEVTALNLVGQSIILDDCGNSIISSKVFGGIRDQPLENQLKPPECINTS